jgi:molybdate transport system substrate-binding protein
LIGLLAAPAPPQPLLIAAAADLSPLQSDLTAAISRATGVPVRFTFAGSGILARQIENGAPYDVYLSANEQFIKSLDKQGRLLKSTPIVYAFGFLGLWSKSGSIRRIDDLNGTLALPNPIHAPYGAAAREMLQRAGLWTRLQPKVVYGENVVETYQYAQSGNADACITSWSIVREKGGVLLNVADYSPIRQSGAVVASSKRQNEARKVLQFLLSPAGKTILKNGGLGTP